MHPSGNAGTRTDGGANAVAVARTARPQRTGARGHQPAGVARSRSVAFGEYRGDEQSEIHGCGQDGSVAETGSYVGSGAEPAAAVGLRAYLS